MTAVNLRAMEILIESARIPARVVVPPPFLIRRAEQLARILRDWNAADVADALAPNVFLDRSPEDWRAESRGLLEKSGPITGMTPLVAENQLRGRFQLLGERGVIEVSLTLMPEHDPKIQEVKVLFREPRDR
jgi:hypothetical protein